MSVGRFAILVAIVGAVIGLQFRRQPITPKTIAAVRPVSRLDQDDIWEIAWSADRRRLAVVGWEKPVEIRSPISLSLQETIGEGKKIVHFAFGPTDEFVAYTENNGRPVLLNRRTGQSRTLNTPPGQAKPAFSPDGPYLATGQYGTKAELWSVADGSHVRSFDLGGAVGGLTPEFSPDGRYLAVGNRNDRGAIFDVATGQKLAHLANASSHGLKFSPDGRRLAVVYVDARLALYRVPDGQLLREAYTKAEELYDVDWSPDGRLLVTSGLGAKITLWDPSDLSVVRELDAPEWVVRVQFSPDGLNIHYAGGDQAPTGKRHLGVLGVEGSLYSILNRPRP